MRKPADTSVYLHPVLAERWSSRAYDPTATIAAEAVENEAVRERELAGRERLPLTEFVIQTH